jgi:hypothetical protein
LGSTRSRSIDRNYDFRLRAPPIQSIDRSTDSCILSEWPAKKMGAHTRLVSQPCQLKERGRSLARLESSPSCFSPNESPQHPDNTHARAHPSPRTPHTQAAKAGHERGGGGRAGPGVRRGGRGQPRFNPAGLGRGSRRRRLRAADAAGVRRPWPVWLLIRLDCLPTAPHPLPLTDLFQPFIIRRATPAAEGESAEAAATAEEWTSLSNARTCCCCRSS